MFIEYSNKSWNKVITSFTILYIVCDDIVRKAVGQATLTLLTSVPQGGSRILVLVDYFVGGFIVFLVVVLEILSINLIYGEQIIFQYPFLHTWKRRYFFRSCNCTKKGIISLFVCRLPKGFRRMFSDLRFMLGFEVDVFTKLCCVVITPLALISIFIYSLVVFQLPTYDDSAYPQIAYGASLGYWRQLTSVTPSPMSRPVPVTATPLSQIRPRHGRGPIESQPCDNCTLASISTHACTGPNLLFSYAHTTVSTQPADGSWPAWPSGWFPSVSCTLFTTHLATHSFRWVFRYASLKLSLQS